jgi:hypothetical protein
MEITDWEAEEAGKRTRDLGDIMLFGIDLCGLG